MTKIKLQIAILSHLSDAQTLMSFEGKEERSRQEINFAITALDRYPDEMKDDLELTKIRLNKALELGEDASDEINQAKKNIMENFTDLELSTDDLDAIFYNA